MAKYYLVCIRCNGYYELEEGESLDDFDSCQCGGELIEVDDINRYLDVDNSVDYNYNYIEEFDESGPTKRKNRTNKSTIFLVSLIILIPLVLLFNNSWLNILNSDMSMMQDHSMMGSDNRGFVLKDVYGSSNTKDSKTIAIVTGIHPRETLSKNVTSDLISKYALNPNTRIIHYDIKVTDNPTDYTEGRNNGEGLAVDYILPDILKSDTDLVIICHDHRQGYGQGFYVATPEMDEKSVKLAEFVSKSIPGFRYYRSDTTKQSSTANIKFSKPLASKGYKTFIYEIPEWYSYNDAYNMTKTLIDKSFTLI